jgi:hypothetical protein
LRGLTYVCCVNKTSTSFTTHEFLYCCCPRAIIVIELQRNLSGDGWRVEVLGDGWMEVVGRFCGGLSLSLLVVMWDVGEELSRVNCFLTTTTTGTRNTRIAYVRYANTRFTKHTNTNTPINTTTNQQPATSNKNITPNTTYNTKILAQKSILLEYTVDFAVIKLGLVGDHERERQ